MSRSTSLATGLVPSLKIPDLQETEGSATRKNWTTLLVWISESPVRRCIPHTVFMPSIKLSKAYGRISTHFTKLWFERILSEEHILWLYNPNILWF